ncbi:MAG: lamin tail domain-containing protein [candidate division Zixibacteria bacterium]
MVRIAVMLLCISSNLYGQVTLSEVLSNEPDGRVRLEWIEIYNRSDLELDLSEYILIADDDTTRFSLGTIIGGDSYTVIARQKLPENGSDSFEGYWGDSSGIWGDSEIENYEVIEGNLRLNNNSGSVTLAVDGGLYLDQFNWSEASDDGRSVEKNDLSLDFTAWHNCYDPGGASPGRTNSEIPATGAETFAMEIQPKMIRSDGTDRFNISVIIPAGAKLSIDVFDDSGLKRRSLLKDARPPIIVTSWDGLDESGGTMIPGVYIIALSLSGQRSDHEFIPVVIAP